MYEEYGQVCLKRGEERAVAGGGRCIYDNQIDWADDWCHDGGIVDVLDSRRRFLGRGFFNGQSKISVRILSFEREEAINADFFRRRITEAWKFRQSLGFENACRVVFGESDGLPGLTVDKFGDYLSFQIVCLGLENWKDTLVEILADLFRPAGIYERDDVAVREKEGLQQKTGCVYGSVPPEVEIREHDAIMLVDIPGGQKTGHFLDQQENRGRLQPYVNHRTVLDLCCCTGGFSIHAALYGAVSVEAVDVSEPALTMVRRNAARNDCADRITTTCADVFDLVRERTAAGRQYGTVILDPPAFAKSRRVLEAAYRGYKELNLQAMKLTEPGGFLISFSCSRFMTRERFLKMITEAAADAGRTVRLLEILLQSRDHPAALHAADASYLKGCILQIM